MTCVAIVLARAAIRFILSGYWTRSNAASSITERRYGCLMRSAGLLLMHAMTTKPSRFRIASQLARARVQRITTQAQTNSPPTARRLAALPRRAALLAPSEATDSQPRRRAKTDCRSL